MNVQLIIEDIEEKTKEVINIEDIDDRNHFSYIDSYGANNDIRIFDDGITIFRQADTHKSYVVLRNEPYIKIKSNEGDLKFLTKVLDLKVNNDNISIVYCVNDSQKSISIKYLGV